MVAVRQANDSDAAAIAAIYNEGIEDRLATFETELRTAATAGPYSDRECYAGVAVHSVYVARDERGRGIGAQSERTLPGL